MTLIVQDLPVFTDEMLDFVLDSCQAGMIKYSNTLHHWDLSERAATWLNADTTQLSHPTFLALFQNQLDFITESSKYSHTLLIEPGKYIVKVAGDNPDQANCFSLFIKQDGEDWVGILVPQKKQISSLDPFKKNLDLYDVALDVAGVGVWHCQSDKVTNIEHFKWQFDSRCKHLLGLTGDNSKAFKKWFYNLDETQRELAQTTFHHGIESKKRSDFEIRFKTASGRYKYLKWIGERMDTSDGNSISLHGIIIDQTFENLARYELKRLNASLTTRISERTRQLEAATKEANAASEAKSNFLAMMSHELRTPMNAIIGSLDLIDYKQLDTEQQELIEMTKNAGSNMVNILNDVLDFSKVEAGKLELESLVFPLREVVANVFDVFIPVATRGKVQLDVFEEATLPELVEGDPNRLRQILFNIVSNAIKFSIDGNDERCVSLRVLALENNRSTCEVSFEITDNGIGMDKKTVNKLFTPFLQADKSTQRKYGGTGLGLSICGYLCDMMGGRVDVKSELNVGSTFTITIPFWLPQADANVQDPLSELKHLNISFYPSDNNNVKFAEMIKYFQQNNFTCTEFSEAKALNSDVLLLGPESLDDPEKMQLLGAKQLSHMIVIGFSESQLMTGIKLPNCTIVELRSCTINKICKLMLRKIEQRKDNNDSDEDFLADFDIDLGTFPEISQQSAGEPATLLENPDILLVEDNPVNQRLLSKQISKLKYSVHVASDGIEGFELWKQLKPKVILTDCHMPNCDGFEMTEKIRTHESQSKEDVKRTPIIAITGAAMREDQDRCRDSGMDDIVLKPIQTEHLKICISRWFK